MQGDCKMADIYEKLAEAIEDVVNEGGGSWKYHRDKVKAACDETLLSEFVDWFAEEQSEESE
jgi:hypothetical protein